MVIRILQNKNDTQITNVNVTVYVIKKRERERLFETHTYLFPGIVIIIFFRY